MSNGFKIGGKCVCVRAEKHPRQGLVIGKTYTIRALRAVCCKGIGGSVILDVGLQTPSRCEYCGYKDGIGWKRDYCFRPLEERAASAELAHKEADRASEQEVEYQPA